MADFFRNHSQLLKVDETVDLRVIAKVDEGQILLHHGEEWDL